MISEPPSEDGEVLSPELVLVSSPEVARRAREQLGERPGPVPFAHAAPVHAEPVVASGSPSTPPVAPASAPVASIDRSPPPAYPRIVFDDLPPEPATRWRRSRIALAVGVLCAVAVGGYLAETRWHAGRSTNDAAFPSAPRALTLPKSRPLGVQPAPAGGHQKTLPKPAAHPSPTRTLPASYPPSTPTQPARPSTALADVPKPRTAKPKPSQPKGPAAFVPVRTWSWAPQQGASAYQVTFFLEGRVVFRARPAESRFVMPSGFRFRAGRYRWTVRSLPAAATAKPIVDSTFVLTPATAAAANGS